MLEIFLPFTHKHRIGFPNIEIWPTESDSQKRAYAIHKTNAVIKNGLPNGGKPTARESNLFYYKERIGLPNIENRLKVIPKKGTYYM